LEAVRSTACSKCEIIIHDLKIVEDKAHKFKLMDAYAIESLPAVVINGKVVDHEAMIHAKQSKPNK
jgi:hypothetical protein